MKCKEEHKSVCNLFLSENVFTVEPNHLVLYDNTSDLSVQ